MVTSACAGEAHLSAGREADGSSGSCLFLDCLLLENPVLHFARQGGGCRAIALSTGVIEAEISLHISHDMT